MLCLDGVNANDLQNVLDYVYDGEVKVKQENLDRFLNIAQKLKLEGLINGDQEEAENLKAYKTENDTSQDTFTPINDPVPPAKTFSKPKPKVQQFGVVQLSHGIGNRELSSSVFQEKDKIDEKIVRNADNSLSCTDCGKVVTGRNAYQNISHHVETHIEGLSYSCNFCDSTFRSAKILNHHRYRNHKQ